MNSVKFSLSFKGKMQFLGTDADASSTGVVASVVVVVEGIVVVVS